MGRLSAIKVQLELEFIKMHRAESYKVLCMYIPVS